MDYWDELYVVIKVLMRARRVRVRERNVILDTDVREMMPGSWPCWKKGPPPEERVASRSWKEEEQILPWSLQGTSPTDTNLSPVRLKLLDS